MPRKALSPQRKRFVEAYLTVANGNGTKAAIAAGYSEHTAGQIASQLLKSPEVEAAVQRQLKRETLTTEQALANISDIASCAPAKVTSSDVLKANELILRVNGALRDKSGESRITVNIGFLSRPAASSEPALDVHVESEAAVEVMPFSTQLPESSE